MFAEDYSINKQHRQCLLVQDDDLSSWLSHPSMLLSLQVAVRRAEAMKWQQMQQAHSALQGQQQQLVAEIQEWKARYRDEAAYSSELQAAANRLQSELTAAQLESQVTQPYSLMSEHETSQESSPLYYLSLALKHQEKKSRYHFLTCSRHLNISCMVILDLLLAAS